MTLTTEHLTAAVPPPTATEVRAELEAWLAEQWDPQLTARQWWSRLAAGRWTAASLPERAGGRGWPADLAAVVGATLDELGMLGPPEGVGSILAAPTIARHGTEEQIRRFIPAILRGEEAWCQLFSEPDAGSDLAGLTTKAVPDEDEWVVTGRKVWTSLAQYADWGMLVARTDFDQPKHLGLTWFALPMNQPGVEVRPLREMTGESFFNEVFLDGARVPAGCVLAAPGEGWRVTQTTLLAERAGVGTGLTKPRPALPGSKAGSLDRPVGELAGLPPIRTAVAADRETFGHLVEEARRRGTDRDPVLRQALVRLWTLLEIDRLSAMRATSAPGAADANVAKLRFAELYRLARDVGMQVVGADGLVTGTGGVADVVSRITLVSPAMAIAGGSDQIQRNIIGERVLGLAREPGPKSDVPFRELLRQRGGTPV